MIQMIDEGLYGVNELGKDIKWNVLVVDETPGDEGQVLPVVDLTAGHHELPVRNVQS